MISKVGSFDRRRLVLIDLQPEEGIVGRSHLERSVRHLMRAICDLAEVRKGQPIASLDDFHPLTLIDVTTGSGESLRCSASR